MSKIATIEFLKTIDRPTITAAIALPETISIGYLDNNQYESEVVINDLSSDNLEAFKKVIDFMSFSVLEDAIIWNMELVDKTFYLAKSYVRDAESTGTVTDVTVGTPLIVQFETPSFTVFNITELSLWYDQAFDPAELTALENVGITVTGDGKQFTIDNTIECKVYFKKPDAVTDVYVINNQALNQVIPI